MERPEQLDGPIAQIPRPTNISDQKTKAIFIEAIIYRIKSPP